LSWSAAIGQLLAARYVAGSAEFSISAAPIDHIDTMPTNSSLPVARHRVQLHHAKHAGTNLYNSSVESVSPKAQLSM
jgi:hypothetical protein